MNKLKEFFELVGVQPNMKFKLKDPDTGIFVHDVTRSSVYYLTCEGTVQKVGGCSFPEYLPKIISGELTIILEPFKPEKGEKFYCISCDGGVNCTTFEPNTFTSDVTNVALGNCFPTKYISDEDYQRIKKIFSDVGADVSEWGR